MRITFNMQAMQMKDMLSTSLNNYSEAVKKASAQQNLIKPWEDTSKYVGAYNVQNMIDELTQFSENANSASKWLNNTDAELKELIDALKKARDDFAIAGASDSYDAESRKALAQDVLSLYKQIMDIANAKYEGRFIFGGFQTDKPPFTGGTNLVTNVVTKNENGENLSGDVITKDVFSDMTELESGRYTAKITVVDGIAKLQLLDGKGNVMIMDSNGSDEAGGSGNKSSTILSFPYEPGKVINTGRGLSFKMPDDLKNPTSVVMEFDYKSGSEISYQGDKGNINTQIGYNQEITVNTPGSNIFTQSSLVLQGTSFNKVNGLPATSNSLFSGLDGTNVGIGDSITVAGTDHNGNPVGIASLVSNDNPQLDLTTASEKERTLTITYGDKLYKIIVPQKAYKSTDELSNAINHELKNAEYLGALNGLEGIKGNITDYEAIVNTQVNSGKYIGAATEAEKQNYKVDLSSQVKISADGGRLNFTSTKSGDNVRLAVTGTDQSVLGFKNSTVAAEGKDITFEIGHEFHTENIDQVYTTHKDMNLSGTSYSFFVNGKEITVNKPQTQITASNQTGIQFGTQDVELEINGRKIKIGAAEFNAVPQADRQAFLNEKLRAAGLGGEAVIDNFVANAAGGFNFRIQTTTPTKKDIEFAFDKALREAGFDFGVGVRLDLNPNDPANLGHYDVTFSLQNYNMDRDTTLTTTAYDRATIPPTSDMKTAKLDRTGINAAEEKTLGDYTNFIKELYGQSVDVSIIDGKLTISDLRSGDSKLTFRTNAHNQGISHANDQVSMIGGAYTGKYNDTWNVTVTTKLGQNDQRNILVTIHDTKGNKLFDQSINDYKGGPIELINGVTITPDDMKIPNPLAPNEREATAKFQIDLKAEPGLNFGDINILETGKNVNIFRSIENLMHALEHNITKNGFGEPSAWKATDLKSTAVPYFDGTFQGNFNDNWKYEILPESNKTNFYLQNEYKASSGLIKFNPDMITAPNANKELDFSVDIFDNKTGKLDRVPVKIDLSKAQPALTDAKTAQEYILKQLNDNPRFVEAGVRFTNKDGKIEIQSGSGTKIANFANSAVTPEQRAFTSYIMGFETTANSKLKDEFVAGDFPITFRVADPLDPAGATFKELNITAPANLPVKKEDVLKLINDELIGGTMAGRIKAEIDQNGSIKFSTKDENVIVEATSAAGAANPLGLGLTHDAANNNRISEIIVSGVQTPKTDLSELEEPARTMTFTYLEGNPNPEKKEVKIVLDKKKYTSVQEMVADINKKLDEKGIPEANMRAVTNGSGGISFAKDNNNFSSIVVEGDYEGTLGFPQAGDSISVKVTNADGGLVQNVALDTAKKSTFVSDGLHLGFNAGSLSATDNFTGAVGSGIENEIPVLDKAVNQVLSASTIVGTRGQRVESVKKFQETVIKNNEEIKAGYLGSTATDLVKLNADVELSLTAYKSAMSLVNGMMSISMLDFLR